MDILIDTDVFSNLFKGSDNAEKYREFLEYKRVCLSFISIAELHAWAIYKNWGDSKITILKDKIKNHIVLPYDYLISLKWAELKANSLLSGNTVSDNDLWLAANSLYFKVALLTENINHFEWIEEFFDDFRLIRI